MSQTNLATGTFPSRKAADQAIRRLVSGGFARNSIELHQHEEDDGYDLEIHTRAENVRRAERLIHASSPVYERGMRRMGYVASDAVHTARSHPFMVLGAGLLAGFVLYNLIPRSSTEESARGRHPARADNRNARNARR